MATTVDEKLEVLGEAFDNCGGVARIRIGGEVAGYSYGNEVFINRVGKPARFANYYRFVEQMNDEDVAELKGMPCWNGNNAYDLSLTLLKVVSRVLDRIEK